MRRPPTLLIALVFCLFLLASPALALEGLELTPTGDALFDWTAAQLVRHFEEQAVLSEEFGRIAIEYFGLGHLQGEELQRELAVKLETEEEYGALEAHMKSAGIDPLAMLGPPIKAQALRDLEGQFGNDPRYWQLLSWVASTRQFDENGELLDNYFAFRSEIYTPLLAAYERGIADATTLLMLDPVYDFAGKAFVERRSQQQQGWRAEHEQEVAEAKAGGQEVPEDYSTYYTMEQLEQFHQQALALVTDFGRPTKLDLYDLVVEANPNLAQAYYTRASAYADFGMFDLALADLQRGNRAPLNQRLEPFPMSAIYSFIGDGKVPGNSAVPGLVVLGNALTASQATGRSVSARNWRYDTQISMWPVDKKLHYYDAVLKQFIRIQEAEPIGTTHWFSAVSPRIGRLLRDVQSEVAPRLEPESAQSLGAIIEELKRTDQIVSQLQGKDMEDWASSMQEDEYLYPVTAEEFVLQLRPLYEKYGKDIAKSIEIHRTYALPIVSQLKDFGLLSLKLKPL